MPTLHVIPVCPFCQRVEILLRLKGLQDAVTRVPVDITLPRDPALLARTRGRTHLPVLVTERGTLQESLVILRYLEARYPTPAVAAADPWERAGEEALIAREGPLSTAGYQLVLNQDPAQRPALTAALLAEYRRLEELLADHGGPGDLPWGRFGLAEVVFAPLFQRFWFLDHYEGFTLPAEGFDRVRRWQEACRRHPAAAQVRRDQILTTYYDYAHGAGNGALLPGRTRSSFAWDPDWRTRPVPPADKYGPPLSDAALGLV